MGSGKQRWKISFHWSQSGIKKKFPNEFTCPISGSLMADPVIVSSGQTFERNCVQICKNLGFKPILSDGCTPDFSTVIPNLSLKTVILNWCKTCFIEIPKPVDAISAEKLVRTLMASQKQQLCKAHSETELTRIPSQLSMGPNDSMVATAGAPVPTTPLPLTTRPYCCSSSSSSDIETLNPNSGELEDIVSRLRSNQVFEQEEALSSLRKITRSREETRVHLCTTQLLSALRSLIISRYVNLQVNAVASLVNLSLENQNKVNIVRSGIVPPLINVLKGGFPESQGHAAGALFSLALDDQNKTAIGVLGALPPLLHALRSDSERTRHDSVLALYHLSLVQSNRSKLVKLGSVQVLLGMVKSGHMAGRVLLVLGNLALCAEGRAAMLDGGAVECFVGMLSRDESGDESIRESCVVALYRLSCGGLRFKGLAKQAGVEEVLMKVEKMGSERGRKKARRVLEIIRGKDEEAEEVDWGELLNSEEVSRTF